MYKELIILREFEIGDVTFLASIRKDIHLQHLLLANPEVFEQKDVQAKILDWIIKRNKVGIFRIIQKEDASPIGFIQISNIHEKNKNGWMGLALTSSSRGHGYGTLAVKSIEEYAEKKLKLRKLLLEVRKDNFAAINLYNKLGWREVGCLNKHYNDGQLLHDVLIYERHLGAQ